ncbi:hypothetical protein H9Q72_006068 [Fusarium xylarioides]|uniref:Uncharacterized protein n=1 Tax=Fusarium xylarioides TaxID=221167 RepID=A0A9P7L1U7_9HYPO|nr:hypothetical protein H9Q72_006068 [Fusarium xylarioides]KAG5810031.1 hypothetical protein H9Q71_005755 [Fusarium xylarioides]KAG5818417.1 hypothetical protein H9Q74_010075 [Fusarium xylarioides]
MAPLMKFAGKELVKLYTYELKDIYLFLKSVANNPESFHIEKADEKRDKLKAIYEQILSLCPLDKTQFEEVKPDVKEENFEPRKQGTSKTDPDFQPRQHIYRRLRRPDDDPGDPKIRVNLNDTWSHHYPLGLQEEKLPYWCHYDLLGLFFSLMGPAQQNSGRFNFFLPLTAVYTRWCFTIGGSRKRTDLHDAQALAFVEKPGHGPAPAIFQCTWGEGEESKVDFSLGASMGGQNFAAKPLPGWKTHLQRARFDLLWNWNDIKSSKWTDSKNVVHDFGFGSSPGKTEFGNCGETYPFIHMLGAHRKEGQDKVEGLALSPSFLIDEDLWNGYSLSKIYAESQTKRDPDDDIGYKYMWSPCPNCKHLITHVDIGMLDRFRPDKTPPSAADLEQGDGSAGKSGSLCRNKLSATSLNCK